MRFILLFLGTAALASSQPRGVELFGTLGALRAAGDEGSEGSGAAYGGAATIPFATRWAVDVQALASRPGRTSGLRRHRFQFSPGVAYRRGNPRSLWFIAFGPGVQYEGASASRAAGFNDTLTGLTLHWRTGAVFQPANRLLLRGEFFWVSRYVLPDVGVALSLGIRLGR